VVDIALTDTEKLLGILPNLIATVGIIIRLSATCSSHASGFCRDAIRRPSLPCRDERVAERVFRAGDVTQTHPNIARKPAHLPHPERL